MSLGAELKRERELRGITLEEIARETKIRTSLLGYLEADRFDRLPSGVFRQSFVRSYARYVGIDEDKPVRECLMVEDKVNATVQQPYTPEPETGRESLVRLLKNRTADVNSSTILPSVVALLGALAIFYFVEVGARTDQAAFSTSKTQEVENFSKDRGPMTAGAYRNNGEFIGVTKLGDRAALNVLGELAPQPSSYNSAEDRITTQVEPRLRIEAREQAWVRVSAGENTLFSGIMRSEETRSFSLRQPLNVKLGNPRGTQIWVNNQVFGELGEAGKTKSIVVSVENYQTFLAGRNEISPAQLGTLN